MGVPAPSTTTSAVIGPAGRSSIWRTAAATSASFAIVLGSRPMTSRAVRAQGSGCFTRMRLKSPSVTTPVSWPVPSTTVVIPSRLSMISSITSRRGALSPTRGSASPSCINSSTRRAAERPMTPPGCRKRKSSALKPRRSSRATARQSPITWATVMLVVGVRSIGQTSRTGPVTRQTSLLRPRAEPGVATMLTSGMPCRSR